MDPVQDGSYAGTMHKNRSLEAIQLELESTLGNYSISYRVYVKDSGWTDWVKDGAIAGTTGQAKPIQAVQIQITENKNSN